MHKSFDTYIPTKILFGRGRINDLGREVAALGKKALMITVPWDDVQAEQFCRIQRILENSGVEVAVHAKVRRNHPEITHINEAAALANEIGAEVILGVGGGSSIDSAKAVAVGMRHPGEPWDYRFQTNKSLDPRLIPPIVAVTTTSGTGSHATKYSVISNAAIESKSSIADPAIFPRVSIVDPELTVSLPEHQTASTAFDAFAHAFESYTNITANPLIDMLCLKAMEIIFEKLEYAMEHPGDVDARAAMAYADTLAGISIANVGTTLPHAIGQPMTGRFPNVTHGESMAVVYPEFIRFSYKSCPSKFAAVARLLDRKLHVLPDMEAAAALEGALVGFMKRVGMYFSREALGVTDDKLDAIIADALTYGDTYVAPKTPTEEEMRRMLADAKTRA